MPPPGKPNDCQLDQPLFGAVCQTCQISLWSVSTPSFAVANNSSRPSPFAPSTIDPSRRRPGGFPRDTQLCQAPPGLVWNDCQAVPGVPSMATASKLRSALRPTVLSKKGRNGSGYSVTIVQGD